MPARLDPEERERRRKERARRTWSGENNAKYNPKVEGFGHEAEWKGAAEERLGISGPVVETSADLTLFGLTKLPATQNDLHVLYRRLSRSKHPDAPGGSQTAFVALGEAYDRLKEKYA